MNTTVQEHIPTNTTQKQTMKKTAKQNYRGSVASYNTRPGNEMGLFYDDVEPTCRF